MLFKKQIWIFLLLLCFKLQATIHDIPSDFNTIQDGINAALPGDTVLVHPGTYFENISFLGKNIHVASLYLTTSDSSFINQTVINGSQMYSVVRFENMETTMAVLTGFTITNGSNMLGGGGILCFAFSSPTLENLIIEGNTGSGGGGIMCYGYANPFINHVVIKNNEAVLYGGGLYCEFQSNPVLNNVQILDNVSYQDGGGAYFLDSCSAIINNTIIKNNFAERNAGGIGCENQSNLSITQTQLDKNSAQNYGGGVFLNRAEPFFDQCIIENNEANAGGGVYAYATQNPTISNSLIQKNRSYISGGGLSVKSGYYYLENVTIRKNIANKSGGGIFCDSSNINFDPINRCNVYLNYAGQTGNDLSNLGSNSIFVIVDTFTFKQLPAKYQVHPTSNFKFDILNGKVQRTSANLYVDPLGNDNNDGLHPDSPLKTLSLALTKALPDSINSQTIFIAGGSYSYSSNGEIFPINIKNNVNLIGDEDSCACFDAENKSSVLIIDQDGDVHIQNLILTGGYSEFGGAIFCNDSDPSLERITIFGNNADYGAGIYCNNFSNPFLLNCTISANYSINGGGIYNNNDHTTLVNSILWDNYPQEIYFNTLSDSGKITIAYSNIKGGQSNININRSSQVFWLEGNLNSDPLFVDTTLSNYTLKDTSICINVGIEDSIIYYDNGNKFLVIPTINYSGIAPDLGAWELFEVISNQFKNRSAFPGQYSLLQNYPNPFNPTTRIDFSIPVKDHVTIKVYDTMGQLVETLLNREMPAGKNSVYFTGNKYASDQYFYIITSGNYTNVRKMLLIK